MEKNIMNHKKNMIYLCSERSYIKPLCPLDLGNI
jgi:hypothetical protein